MPKSIFKLIMFLLFAQLANAQEIKVLPYLQDATPHSIYIIWETNMSDQSIVEYGLTNSLGISTSGIAYPSEGDGRIHEVKLENLTPFTKYYYRVKTGLASSDIYTFKTSPHASAHEPFRIVAMSDMQQDSDKPDKFREIVEDGVIDYLTDEFGGELIDNLALVMIPGDLVSSGNNYSSWEETFFTPAKELFSHIPVYPVLGNHEDNSDYYFRYFKMPENGTVGSEEHWWHKDYGNVRIVGLNSNPPYDTPEQLAWLDTVLTNTCAMDSIDFVFAELHHPHKSELWTPGESDFTGDVISRLEQFSTDCNKPSIHFFGHTHGYSRGHSRDHKHLWINVATAGGAIDNWGEFPNFDYEEFAVSEDEYGFVLVEVTDDADPKLVIKRITRGDQDEIIDNELTDIVTMRLNPIVINTPTPIYPVNIMVAPECVELKAGVFSSPNQESEHGQAHWQVTSVANDFSSPDAESWKNFENWYFEEDTQADDDLKDEKIIDLEENTNYWWRVRYRDKELNWSDWSNPTPFSTSNSINSGNLLLNPGAEDSLANWTVTEGIVEALVDGVCAGTSPHSGERYFAVGGLCEESDVGILVQNVDVSPYSVAIDDGNYSAYFGGYFSDYNGTDLPEMRLIYLEQNGVEIGSSETLSILSSSWTLLSLWSNIPPMTRSVRVELKGTRNGGQDNDSYIDDVFLKVGDLSDACDGTTKIVNQSPQNLKILSVSPNPVLNDGFIQLPKGDYTDLRLYISDIKGTKIFCPTTYHNDGIEIKTDNLANGNYFFWVKDKGKGIGVGKFIK